MTPVKIVGQRATSRFVRTSRALTGFAASDQVNAVDRVLAEVFPDSAIRRGLRRSLGVLPRWVLPATDPDHIKVAPDDQASVEPVAGTPEL
ncbi:hypothetical protein [Streptomyces sp. NPDC102360]|uniref:hypothetical protein n=1 Tax=Streptomyces sp. NPDC102360 TaxID=3366160 RepID=UPI0038232424